MASLVSTVDFTAGGVAYRSVTLSAQVVDVFEVLTPSEQDVAIRAACGASTAAIAEARGSSRRTISHQLGSVFRKLGVAGRSALSLHAFAPELDRAAL